MKKRLRKKLHKKEFVEYGFSVSFRFKENLSVQEIDRFIDQFIDEPIEGNRLQFGGGGTEIEWQVVVSRAGRGSATEEHRQLLDRWFRAQPEIVEYRIGELEDLWCDCNSSEAT